MSSRLNARASDDSEFTFERTTWRHRPIAEILRNGKQFWEDFPGSRPGFQFGRYKAALIIIFLEEIKSFVNSGGALPGTEENPKTIEIKGRTLKWYPRFKKKSGEIEHPYLELAYGKSTIRFGLTKAHALLLFQKELAELASAK
jgi:hypothetical protein